MDINLDNFKKLLERIRTIGLWGRIFKWQEVKDLLFDAVAEMQDLKVNKEILTDQIADLKAKESSLSKDIALATTNEIHHSNEINNLQNLISQKTGEIARLNDELTSSNTRFEVQAENINKVETANALLIQKNEQISASLKNLSEQNATDKEALTQVSEAKNKLENIYQLQRQNFENILAEKNNISNENATNKEALTQVTEIKISLEKDAVGLNETIKNLRYECDQLKKLNTQLTSEEDARRQKFDNDVSTLNSIKDQIQNDRNEEITLRNNVEIERLKSLKDTWGRHQDNVKSILKGICNKHIIEYVDKVSFKLEPDNTLKICDEYVIFDAKSPGADDLRNFPNYLKDQTEKAKKYAKQDGIKKDIFFVVPSNTLDRISQFVYNLVDYDVYIISVDSLEQIILSLKKIESYDLAEALRPEDRDNICRVLGKFAHLSKRRIQIDSFFAKQFIELAYKSENDLPKEIFDQTVKYERSEKLNPPQERRAKAIPTKDLEADSNQIDLVVSAKGIVIDDLKLANGLNDLALYKVIDEEIES